MAQTLEQKLEAAAKKQAQWARRTRLSQKRLEHWRKIWNKTKRRKDTTDAEQAKRKMAFWRDRRDSALRRRAFWRELYRTRKIRWQRWVASRRSINWNGKAPVASRKVRRVLRYGQRKHGFIVTSTTGGVHSPTSWHYQSKAVDVICSDMAAAQLDIERHFGTSYFLELFGPASRYVKNGYVVNAKFPDHDDHIHIAA